METLVLEQRVLEKSWMCEDLRLLNHYIFREMITMVVLIFSLKLLNMVMASIWEAEEKRSLLVVSLLIFIVPTIVIRKQKI